MKKTHLQTILLLSGFIIAVVIGLLVYWYYNPYEEMPGCGTKDNLEFPTEEPISLAKKKGRALFDSNCVACHKMNGKNTPDLIKGVFERMPNEVYFDKFITSEDSLRSINDPYAKRLMEEFPSGFLHSFELSTEEIENLKEYIQ